MALGGGRPYFQGCCTVCNYVFWKSRSSKGGIALPEMGDKRWRRPTKRIADEELEVALIAGSISSGSAYKFWLQNLEEVRR